MLQSSDGQVIFSLVHHAEGSAELVLWLWAAPQLPDTPKGSS